MVAAWLAPFKWNQKAVGLAKLKYIEILFRVILMNSAGFRNMKMTASFASSRVPDIFPYCAIASSFRACGSSSPLAPGWLPAARSMPYAKFVGMNVR